MDTRRDLRCMLLDAELGSTYLVFFLWNDAEDHIV
jgi:hypothetical protein